MLDLFFDRLILVFLQNIHFITEVDSCFINTSLNVINSEYSSNFSNI